MKRKKGRIIALMLVLAMSVNLAAPSVWAAEKETGKTESEKVTTLQDEAKKTVEKEKELKVASTGAIIDSGTCGENVTWELTDDGTLTISGTGEMYDYDNTDDVPWDAFDYDIYNVIIKEGVTSIGNLAFDRCFSLFSVTISDSVTNIGDTAFTNCISLTNVNIPQRVTSIGEYAFNGCSNLVSITIPEGVTNIENGVFNGCSSLVSITIPNSVTSIGDWAFIGCKSLTSITIPNRVTSIGESAFNGCSSLVSITIPDSVTRIEYSTFCGCSSLVSITIPDSVISISDWAFQDCSSLTSMTIPEGVTGIGVYAFAYCINLTNITIPSSVRYIGYKAFEGCPSLTSIDVENNNSSYSSENGVLFNKDKTELIKYPGGNLEKEYLIPNSSISIEDGAFDECKNLINITISDNVTSIGEDAFAYCINLTNITILSGVTTIGIEAFEGCSSLISIDVENDNSSYSSENGVLFNKDKTELIKYPSGKLEKEYLIPNSVINIGEDAFAECMNLTNITIPNNVISIGECAFTYCTNLINITILSGVTTIEGTAFRKCINLKYIVLPKTITSIGLGVFDYCDKLSDVYYDGNESERERIDIDAGNNSLIFATWHYNSTGPRGEKVAYGACGDTLTWTLYNDGVLKISGNGEMYDWSATEEQPWYEYVDQIRVVNIESGVQNIGKKAFEGINKLKAVSIPDTVKKMGEYSFAKCASLEKVVLPNGVDIYDYAFAYTGLSEINFMGTANFVEQEEENSIFKEIVASDNPDVKTIAHYPKDDATWTSDKLKDYGNRIKWEEWEPLLPVRNYEYAELTELNCQIRFGTSNIYSIEQQKYAYLMSSDDDSVIDKVELSSCEQSGTSLNIKFNNYDKTKLSAGKKYYVLIDPGAIKFNDGTIFSGIQEKDSWCFQTVSIELPSLANDKLKGEIDDSLYRMLYRPATARLLKKRDDGTKGICYGLSYAGGAWKENYQGIHSIGANRSTLMDMIETDTGNSSFSFQQYVQLAHIYQMNSDVDRQIKKENKNQYEKLYKAIKDFRDGGKPIIICFQSKDGGHALFPLGIISENDNSVEVAVYDCNYPLDDRYDKNVNNYVQKLTLQKSNGVIQNWEYGGYVGDNNKYYISFTDVSNIPDDKIIQANTEKEKSNLIYSETSISEASPIDSFNGERENNSQYNLYWTDKTSIARTAGTKDDSISEIGLTDGYNSVSVSSSLKNNIEIDLTKQSVQVVNPDKGENRTYEISYEVIDDNYNETQMTIAGETSGEVNTEQNDKGILVDSDDLQDITITTTENQQTESVTISTGQDKVLIGKDESGDTAIYVDKEGNGIFDTDVSTLINIENAIVTVSNQTYTGQKLTPKVTVKLDDVILKEGLDYRIAYYNNVNAGTATVKIIGKGDYIGITKKTFKINAKKISDDEISLPLTSYIYSGKELKPKVTVKSNEVVLQKDTDYAVSYLNNINAGTATVTIKGKGNYTGTVTKTFKINAKKIAGADVSLSTTRYIYSGKARTPKVTVKSGNVTLIKGTDYTVTYSNNTNVGAATVTVTGKGNYTGTVNKPFTIKAKDMSDATVKLSTTNYTYNGYVKKPSVTVKDSNGNTISSEKYSVSYASGRKYVGRYSVKVTFKGNYTGNKTVYFEIGPKNPSTVSATLYGYDDVKVSWSKVSGVSGYKVYYKKSTSGSYTYLGRTSRTYTYKKNLSDGAKYYFKVVAYKTINDNRCENAGKTDYIYTLKKVSTPRLSKSGTKVKVRWTNISGESGYQISKSTSKTGTNIVSTYKTTSGTYKTLTATKGKYYYYKVRAYKTVGSKKVYGPWSTAVRYKR